MRISDWSSDVCSSDLTTVFEMAEFDGHLYAGTANPITGGELWKTRGGDLPYHWTKVFDRGAGDMVAFRKRSGRSEEHTSELQSLMRISYAVFCLKKKKNTSIRIYHSIITTRNKT